MSILTESYEKSEIQIAEKYARNLLNIARQPGEKFYQSAAYGYLGLIYRSKGDAGNALKYLNKALNLSKKHGFKALAETICNLKISGEAISDCQKET